MIIPAWVATIVKAFTAFLEAESQQPPYPFDDSEGETIWREWDDNHQGSLRQLAEAKQILKESEQRQPKTSLESPDLYRSF
ncbi:hypothetical protein [Hymenobacter lucidus]|uniref:Uncharacterized protein n=1 Tax=Hymenobacter lucidus TaxID=2880930 RepID=A0ABS8AYC5_9BACT|nr:hypothetical protein [Hymenobacter lucidus]MCB2410794.1 hypothetical protein [Hymenobacter lucidus]